MSYQQRLPDEYWEAKWEQEAKKARMREVVGKIKLVMILLIAFVLVFGSCSLWTAFLDSIQRF